MSTIVERIKATSQSIFSGVSRWFKGTRLAQAVNRSVQVLGRFRVSLSGLIGRGPLWKRFASSSLMTNIVNRARTATTDKSAGSSDLGSYSVHTAKLEQSKLTSTMIALRKKNEQLVRRVRELEAYYHVDAGIVHDEVWEDCIIQVKKFRATYLEFVNSVDVNKLSVTERDNLVELKDSMLALRSVMDEDQAHTMIELLAAKQSSHNDVVKLASNPWVMGHLKSSGKNEMNQSMSKLIWNSAKQSAQSLMAKSQALFVAIPKDEFFNLKDDQCPNHKAYASYFDHIKTYVSHDILSHEHAAQRSMAMSYWIEVLEYSLNSKDFFTANAVYSALTSTEIHRLASTKSGLAEQYQNMMERYSDLFNVKNVMENLRGEMEKSDQSVIYVGSYRVQINMSNEHHDGVKVKFKNTINDLIDLNKSGQTKDVSALDAKIASLESLVASGSVSKDLGLVVAHLRLAHTLISLGQSSDAITKQLLEAKNVVSRAKLIDFPEAKKRAAHLLKCHKNLAGKVPVSDVDASVNAAVSGIDTGQKMDDLLYKQSLVAEPRGVEPHSQPVLNGDDRLINMKVSIKPTISKLNNAYLRNEMIQRGVAMKADVKEKHIATLNDMSVNLVDDDKLAATLRKVGLNFDAETVRAINAENKQMFYRGRIRSDSVRKMLDGTALKSVDAGLFGGRSTGRRIEELNKIYESGEHNRARLSRKVAKLTGNKRRVDDSDYLSFIDDQKDHKRRKRTRTS